MGKARPRPFENGPEISGNLRHHHGLHSLKGVLNATGALMGRTRIETMTPAHRPVPFAVWLGLAWALAAALLLAWRWGEFDNRVFDADDAMRLVQVREFLAGRGWFDLHQPRLDPPSGYDGHWSRLIDLGLTGLFLAARPFAGVAGAEIFMRAVWPLVWLLAAIGGTAALAWRIAGRTAALLALVVAASALPAFQHFKPGTIDHHNVQVALAMAVVAAAAWSDRNRGAATFAGLLTGLALSIGLESIFFVVLGGATIALRFIADGRAGVALMRYGWAAAASLCVGFLLSVGPVLEPCCL